MEWTHEKLQIIDIRRLKRLYALKIDVKEIDKSLLINSDIFNEILKSYFLKDIKDISREDILKVRWNMYISKGYYIKQNSTSSDNLITEHPQDPDKWYVSFFEIDGPLSSLENIMQKQIK